ncbi:MAG: hypothetical protein MK096_14510 [Oleiphilaceae bacterium]|nr:hypothetical protein A3762_05220 [Oleiphilus sp. HI0125]MCH2159977.1 hypothetical protein [Oleiphilaceae bacterium]
MRFFIRLRTGYLWGKAVYFASEGIYSKSYDFLIRLDDLEVSTRVHWSLLQSHVCMRLGKNAEATKSLRKALSGLKVSKRFNSDEKAYLTKYARAIAIELGQGFDEIVPDYNLAKVDDRWISLFPIGAYKSI